MKDSFESEKNYQKKMNELKREKFSLKETLKKLDAKFDDGNISEVDYFKFFSKLQKKLYIINSNWSNCHTLSPFRQPNPL